MKEALETYNKLGVSHNIMFKLNQTSAMTNGIVGCFSLICVYSKMNIKKTPFNGGVQIKAAE